MCVMRQVHLERSSDRILDFGFWVLGSKTGEPANHANHTNGAQGKKEEVFRKKWIGVFRRSGDRRISMKTTEKVPDGSMFEQESQLQIAAFYEDVRTGEWAKGIFDRIRRRLPWHVRAELALWRFDVLQDAHVKKLARADAAQAALVVVAAGGAQPMPEAVIHCLEKSLKVNRRERVGLAALLDERYTGVKDTSPVYRQLQALSTIARLRLFFLPCGDGTHVAGDEESFEHAAPGCLDDSLFLPTHCSEHWGLNE